jgi:hypothetical protein
MKPLKGDAVLRGPFPSVFSLPSAFRWFRRQYSRFHHRWMGRKPEVQSAREIASAPIFTNAFDLPVSETV